MDIKENCWVFLQPEVVKKLQMTSSFWNSLIRDEPASLLRELYT
jgi:hypothetical protein